MNLDTPQMKLKRMSEHFDDIGIYTKASYCLEIIDYIDDLEKFRGDDFKVYPNIDLDIDNISKNG